MSILLPMTPPEDNLERFKTVWPGAESNTGSDLKNHLDQLGDRWSHSLATSGRDIAIVSAGKARLDFQDDQGPTFQPNPNFLQWIEPRFASENSLLLLSQETGPKLLFYQPEDYWHATPPPPDHLAGEVEIEVFKTTEDLDKRCFELVTGRRTAYIGDEEAIPDINLVIASNPTELVNQILYTRAVKTTYELSLIRKASVIGARGHLAAKEGFEENLSEFEIHIKFLEATGLNEHALPYGNIVAQNDHASLLHYQHQERHVPDPILSLLIDAGGSYKGYASDITRTYCTNTEHEVFEAGVFKSLILAITKLKDIIIAEACDGTSFVDLQRLMHQTLARILNEHRLINISPDEAFESGLTELFCPHGLGHILGLQVHDVGGQQISADGTLSPPPTNYPSLRLTRPLCQDMVLTIEPGLYFVPSLLRTLQNSKSLDWKLIERLIPFGGIRVEDNIRINDTGNENLTLNAFQILERQNQ